MLVTAMLVTVIACTRIPWVYVQIDSLLTTDQARELV